MHPLVPCLAALLAAAPVPEPKPDPFDLYLNPTLAKALEGNCVRELKEVKPATLLANDRVLDGVHGAVLIVKTTGGRHAKLVVQPGRQKIDADKAVPILLVDRFVTYKEGDERTVLAAGKNVMLFPGYRLSLDLGQVVPGELPADLEFVADGDKVYARPLGDARLFLLEKALPGVVPPKPDKVVVTGDAFETRYFNGTYKLYDDGRRQGTLTLKVDGEGNVTGGFYSDKDGQKYDVKGKAGGPAHAIAFTVHFPRTEQAFKGLMFTGDAKAIAGSSKVRDRETAFYAVRE